jgi:adenylate kinase family enzyme
VGTTGSGKTTLARQISQSLNIPHVELDALHWGAGWTPMPPEVFRERVAQALSGDTWAVDGNYGKVRDIVWVRADTIVWLDYVLPVVLMRLAWRTLRRIFTREELWCGNRETLSAQFFSGDSLFLWALRTYPRRRREYPGLFQLPEHAHLAIVHLRSPRAAREWLESLR